MRNYKTGRWTSKEPLGFARARNWYVYAGDDGVNRLDINGLSFDSNSWLGENIRKVEAVNILKYHGNFIEPGLGDIISNVFTAAGTVSGAYDWTTKGWKSALDSGVGTVFNAISVWENLNEKNK